jgi:CRP/FNR family cyclic AMP-dependent transcriptional regulator
MTNFKNLFFGLPVDVQEEITSAVTIRSLKAGDTLCAQGDACTEMYQIVEGEFKASNFSADGKEVILAKLQEGDTLGEIGLIDNHPRTSFAFALVDSKVNVLSKSNFDRIYDKYPVFSRRLNQLLSLRLRLAMNMVEDASMLSLNQRLARLVFHLVYSHGENNLGTDSYTIDVSHEELAAMLGSARQSVSKELKALENEGFILVRYGKIHVIDLANLKEKYGQLMGSKPFTWNQQN